MMPYIEEFIGDVNNLLQQIYSFNAVVHISLGELCKSNTAEILGGHMRSAELLAEKMVEFERKYKAGDIIEKG